MNAQAIPVESLPAVVFVPEIVRVDNRAALQEWRELWEDAADTEWRHFALWLVCHGQPCQRVELASVTEPGDWRDYEN